MSAGLTFNADSVNVKVGDTTVDTSNYTVTPNKDGYTFVVEFKDSYIVTLPKNTKIEVYYTATLNENAVVEGNGNPNELDLAYGENNTTDKVKTTTYTYKFNIIKKDGETKTKLEGATFKLFDKNNNIIYVELIENNVYRVTTEENDVLINAGEATIEGLDADTYYLEEVTAPTGYNKLTSKVEVIISKVGSNNTFSRFTAEVLNYTGSKLPETGGMGTTLFLTFGSILVIGFGLLLVTKLRVYKENI